MNMRQFFLKINQRINEHANKSVYPYMTFAIFGIITYPLYYLIWRLTDSQGYDNLWFRLITVFLCILLALKDYWPKKIQLFFPLYWYFTLLYSLPFLFTFLLLKNHMSYTWSMNTMTTVLLLILLLDLIAFIIILLLGISLGIICFFLLDGAIQLPSDYMTILITYCSIVCFGSIFSYRKDQLKEAEKKIKKAEAEQLKIKNEAHLSQLKVQEQFTKTASQVAHDIRSPLASLLIILKSCTDIPEDMRISMRTASMRIDDIANNLLNQYRAKDLSIAEHVQDKQPVLLSAALLQLQTEKKFQYQNLPITFECIFNPEGQFIFIQIEPSAFQRMISNLINNSVDSFEKKEGKIIIRLMASSEWVKISVEDNGKGMSNELIKKLQKNIPITVGKSHGHGIGLSQIHETVRRNHGKLIINSIINQGTQMILEFPRLPTPSWCAEKICLRPDDLVLILDDDPSIHGAWNARFESILKKFPTLEIHHFEIGQEVIHFVEALSEEKMNDVILLTDFELLKQSINGLDVISQCKIERTILVTSHYAELTVREQAARLGTKILPKQLASEIPIFVENADLAPEENSFTYVDAVIVDDSEELIAALKMVTFAQYKVDTYYHPDQLKNNIQKYPKNTRIYLDNDFGIDSTDNGLDIAKWLHKLNYSRLYLISGNRFNSNDIPEYLTVIDKADIANIKDEWDK